MLKDLGCAHGGPVTTLRAAPSGTPPGATKTSAELPDGSSVIASAGADAKLRLWHCSVAATPRVQLIASVEPQGLAAPPVGGLVTNAKASTLFVASADGSVDCWIAEVAAVIEGGEESDVNHGVANGVASGVAHGVANTSADVKATSCASPAPPATSPTASTPPAAATPTSSMGGIGILGSGGGAVLRSGPVAVNRGAPPSAGGFLAGRRPMAAVCPAAQPSTSSSASSANSTSFVASRGPPLAKPAARSATLPSPPQQHALPPNGTGG